MLAAHANQSEYIFSRLSAGLCNKSATHCNTDASDFYPYLRYWLSIIDGTRTPWTYIQSTISRASEKFFYLQSRMAPWQPALGCPPLFSLFPRLLLSLQAFSSTRKAKSSTGSNKPPQSVTLTSHYQIQLVPGPALLLKPHIPWSPPSHAPSSSVHPPPPSALSASPASVQSSRSTCVHHGDKAERGRKSVPLICTAAASLSPPSLRWLCRAGLGEARAMVTCLDRERRDCSRLLRWTER